MTNQEAPRYLSAEPKNRIQQANRELIGDIITCSALADAPLYPNLLDSAPFFAALPELRKKSEIGIIRSETESMGRKAGEISFRGLSDEDARSVHVQLATAVTASVLTGWETDAVPNADIIVPTASRQLIKFARVLGEPPRTTDSTSMKMDTPFLTDDRFDVEGTSVRGEAIIKMSVGRNWDNQAGTNAAILEMTQLDVEHPRFAELARKVAQDFELMVSGITVLRKYLTDKPEGMVFFMDKFMKDTKPYIIDGEEEIHSGSQFFAAHAADEADGVTSIHNPQDVLYRKINLKYATRLQKFQLAQIQANVERWGTLTQQVIERPSAVEGAKALWEMVKAHVQFRNAHTTGIKKSEHLRPHGESSGKQLPMAFELRNRSIDLSDELEEVVKQRAA